MACGLNEMRFEGFVTRHPADFYIVITQTVLFLVCLVGNNSLQCFGVTVCKR